MDEQYEIVVLSMGQSWFDFQSASFKSILGFASILIGMCLIGMCKALATSSWENMFICPLVDAGEYEKQLWRSSLVVIIPRALQQTFTLELLVCFH